MLPVVSKGKTVASLLGALGLAAIGSRFVGTPRKDVLGSTGDITVHVAGQVKNPGVYHLAFNSRANDAVTAAGGATPEADLDALNLAAITKDGQKIVVPAKSGSGEIVDSVATAPENPNPRPKAPVEATVLSAPGGSENETPSQPRIERPAKEAPVGKVSLASATLNDLETLPGIGPVTAQKILDYRDSGHTFQTIQELRNVSGIGPKKFAKLEPYVVP